MSRGANFDGPLSLVVDCLRSFCPLHQCSYTPSFTDAASPAEMKRVTALLKAVRAEVELKLLVNFSTWMDASIVYISGDRGGTKTENEATRHELRTSSTKTENDVTRHELRTSSVLPRLKTM